MVLSGWMRLKFSTSHKSNKTILFKKVCHVFDTDVVWPDHIQWQQSGPTYIIHRYSTSRTLATDLYSIIIYTHCN